MKSKFMVFIFILIAFSAGLMAGYFVKDSAWKSKTKNWTKNAKIYLVPNKSEPTTNPPAATQGVNPKRRLAGGGASGGPGDYVPKSNDGAGASVPTKPGS